MKWVPSIVLGCALASAAADAATARAPDGGTIAIEATTGDGQPISAAFRDALAETLDAEGFTVLSDPDHVGYLAEIVVRQDTVGTAMEKTRRDPVDMIGTGASIPLQSGGYTASALRRTRLEMSIRKRDGDVVWHGIAVTVRAAGPANGKSAAVAHDLAHALLGGYPEQPEDVVGVP